MEHQLYIQSANSLTALADKLTKVIRTSGASVFQPHYIVTQTDGMSSWLKMTIAENAGIAANLVFLKPNELVNKMYYASGGEWEKTLSAADIQWLIYEALGSRDIKNSFRSLANYYEPDGRADNPRRIALAREVADLFDQYQVYRPEMLQQWRMDQLATNEPDEEWQKELWRRIQTRTETSLPDKAKIKTTIIEKLQDVRNVERLQQRIPAVYFFGTSLLTSFHHEILWTISEYIPVYLFLPNPAPDIYWYEDKSQKEIFYLRKRGRVIDDDTSVNPLLVTWGKLIQNTFQLFFQNEETINLYEEEKRLNASDTLLSGLQNLIYENTIADANKFSDEQLQDGSILIQSCFSPLREVESLYNYLIKVMDAHPQKYAARDVVVHVTDINKYASYIRSVFNNAPRRLRYSIADESYAASDSISQALYEMLTLDEQHFTSESVMQLLNFSSVRKHFNITDVAALRRVVEEANICHGIEGSVDDESHYVSWRYGLQRIMYGVCIGGGAEYGSGETSFFPLDSVEGSVANEVIHFVYLVEKLIALLRERKDERTVTEWTAYIMDVLRLLIFDEEEKDNTEYQQLMEKIHEMTVDAGLFEEPVSFQVFLMQFLPGLQELTQTWQFARGGITFCSLIPMRSIPFKIVAMLGIDFDKFPRKPVKSGFDLMAKHPRRGDRNIKVNDKHLFLETILSAGDYLYLSYNGQRIQDNSVMPPSILVDELLSFIKASSQNPERVHKALVRHQPLHGFSARYGNEAGYFTYLLSENVPVALEQEVPEDAHEQPEIKLEDLISFLSDPIKFYFKNVLGVYLDAPSVTLPETEKFDLDNLEKWVLKTDMLLMDEVAFEDFVAVQKKKGHLPLKNAGAYEVQKVSEEMKAVKECFQEERNGLEPATETFQIQIAGYQLTATMDFIFGNKILVPCFSKNPNKYLLRASLKALMVGAAQKDYQVIFIGNEKLDAKRLSQAESTKCLVHFINIFRRGHDELLPFNISWYDSAEKTNGVSQSAFNKKMEDCVKNDAYLKIALQEIGDNFLEQYKSLASEILPVINDTFTP